MEKKPTASYILGAIIFFIFGILGGIGLTLNMGFINFDLDRLIAFWALLGILCAYIANKKNKTPEIFLVVCEASNAENPVRFGNIKRTAKDPTRISTTKSRIPDSSLLK